MSERIYHQRNIKAKMQELVINAGCLILHELLTDEIPSQAASITYFESGNLSEPQDGVLAA